MGTKGEETRQRLLDATVSLVEERGYFGTGLNSILAASGAPRGSLYFHFPGGKDELVAKAIGRAAGWIREALDAIEATDMRAVAAAMAQAFGDRLEASGWRKGCPIATVALEVAGTNSVVQDECRAAYAGWEAALRERLIADGHPNPDDSATAILAMIEGGLLLAQVQGSREPLERIERVVGAML